MSLKEISEKEGINEVYYFDVYALQLYWGLTIELSYLQYFVFHYLLLLLDISYHFIFLSNLKVKFFFIKFTITSVLILLLWNFKNQLVSEFPCSLIIKVIMQILFAVLMDSLFLPKYKFCRNESFLSNISIKTNGSLTCVAQLLILSLIVNTLLKTTKFHSIVILVLIILFMVSTRKAFSQNNLFIFSVKELPFYCYLDVFK